MDPRYKNLKKINKVFLSCYFKSQDLENKFETLIEESRNSYEEILEKTTKSIEKFIENTETDQEKNVQ